MGKKILVAGGGIIGLSSAWFLHRAGHQVTIVDKSSLTDGCSFGNAGMIVPSHFIPLAAPGMVEKGIRWMFNSKSPFFVRPRLSLDLMRWGWHFIRHANARHVDRSAPVLKELSLLSKKLYQDWNRELPFRFGYHERGLLMLYKDAAVGHEEAETAEMANRLGIEAKVLNEEQVQALEPDVRVSVLGGVFFPGDAHLTPRELAENMIRQLRQEGAEILENTAITRFVKEGSRIAKVETADRTLAFDELVLAAGSWSGELARQLDLNLPMQAGKGYSFTLKEVKKNVRVPSIFLEARVAVTPMGDTLRFGGTMEIIGVDHRINMNRVRGIVESIPKYYPDMHVSMPAQEEVWHGLRPCSPDGLPYIGRLRSLENVLVATGHSMMGLSLAPATGQLVSELVNGGGTTIDIGAFEPERYR